MRRRYFLRLAYQGTHYHGWQIQPNAVTVQEILNKRISVMLGEAISCYGCGRTDTGVHASDFVAHFDTERELDRVFIEKLNRFLPHDIAVYELYQSRRKAHARFDVVQRTYRYCITQYKNPFTSYLKTYFFEPVDIEMMQLAADLLPHYTDFEAFCKSGGNQGTFLCELYHAQWSVPAAGELRFEVTANRFLRGMVRLLVGTMMLVGRNKMSVADFRDLLEKRVEAKTRVTNAPPDGLYLAEVRYPEGLFEAVPRASLLHN
jgi:tRNA pseudouridine38-40 synthase